PLVAGGKAAFAQGVSMHATLVRMRQCRAVLSVSPLGDMVHDRTQNALNAGCLVIAEDNIANRAVLEHGKTALLFRYDDDSLQECLETACHDQVRSYAIARSGFAMRDLPPLRFGQFA